MTTHIKHLALSALALALASSCAHAGDNTTCKLANVFASETNIEIIVHSDIKGPWQSGLIRDNQSSRGELTPERWGLGINAPNGTPPGEIYQNKEISPQEDEPGCSYKLERVKPGMHIIKLNDKIIDTMTGPIPKNDAQIK